MYFDRTWVLLALVKLFAQQLGQHLVDSEIGQERIVVLQQLTLVLELLEIALQLVETNHFRDARDIQILNLVLEGTSRVLNDHADARVLILVHKWLVNLDHLWLG